MKKTAYDIWKWEYEYINDAVRHSNMLLDAMIRGSMKSVEPPIKGRITPGKLKWRGLRLCSQPAQNGTYFWIEQRGKHVCEKFLFSAVINQV